MPKCDWTHLFGDRLVDKEGRQKVEVPSASALDGKHVAIYFSAHWCPPCRQFTPQLANTYSKLKKDGKDFEVVFVSMDRNKAQFDEYFATMPWMAIPYEDDQLRSVLSRKFQVAGIPALIILAPDSTVINSNARQIILDDPQGEKFPWAGMAGKEPKLPAIPWILFAFLIWYLVNTYLFPPSPKKV